jgi:hypothetical protein
MAVLCRLTALESAGRAAAGIRKGPRLLAMQQSGTYNPASFVPPLQRVAKFRRLFSAQSARPNNIELFHEYV